MTGWPMLFLTHAIADTTAARGFRRILPDRDPRGRQCTTRDSSRARRSATSSAFGSPRSTGGSGPDGSPPRCASARGRCAGASRKSPAGSSRWKGPNPRPRDKSRAAALGRDIRNPRVLMHGPATCAPELELRRERRVASRLSTLPFSPRPPAPASLFPRGPTWTPPSPSNTSPRPAGTAHTPTGAPWGWARPNPRNSIPTFRRQTTVTLRDAPERGPTRRARERPVSMAARRTARGLDESVTFPTQWPSHQQQRRPGRASC